MGFEDLPNGRLNQLNPAYFQYLDGLLDILVAHEIVPVLQPVFFGVGRKGLSTAGKVVPPEEYAHHCRYLVARYGARPAIYFVGGIEDLERCGDAPIPRHRSPLRRDSEQRRAHRIGRGDPR